MDERIEFKRCCALCGQETREGERARMTTASPTFHMITLEMHGHCLVELLNRHVAKVTIGDLTLY